MGPIQGAVGGGIDRLRWRWGWPTLSSIIVVVHCKEWLVGHWLLVRPCHWCGDGTGRMFICLIMLDRSRDSSWWMAILFLLSSSMLNARKECTVLTTRLIQAPQAQNRMHDGSSRAFWAMNLIPHSKQFQVFLDKQTAKDNATEVHFDLFILQIAFSFAVSSSESWVRAQPKPRVNSDWFWSRITCQCGHNDEMSSPRVDYGRMQCPESRTYLRAGKGQYVLTNVIFHSSEFVKQIYL